MEYKIHFKKILKISHYSFFKILFFTLVVYLPFQVALNPFPGIDLASGRIIISILIVYWLYHFFVRSHKKVIQEDNKLLWKKDAVKNVVGIFLILFLLWSVFSLFWADNFSFAFRKIVLLLNIAPLYFVAQMFLKTKKDLKILFKALIYSSFLVAIISISQFISQFIFSPYFIFNKLFLLYPLMFGKTSTIAAMIQSPNWLAHINGNVFMRSIGSFPDPNTLGFYLSFVIPGTFLIKEKYFKIIGIFLILTLLFTFSRGAYLGFIVSFIAFFVLTILKYYNYKKNNLTINNKKQIIKDKSQIKKIILMIFLFISFILLFLISPIGNRLFSSFNFKDNGITERIEIWNKAIDIILENPVIGVGIGNYAHEVDLFSEQRGPRSPIHAHNIYLQIASELGIIGIILWICIFIFAIKNTIRNYDKNLFMAVFLSLIWFSIHGFFDVPIFSPRILPLLVIFLALSGNTLKNYYELK